MKAKQSPLKYIKTEKHLHQCGKTVAIIYFKFSSCHKFKYLGENIPTIYFFVKG